MQDFQPLLVNYACFQEQLDIPKSTEKEYQKDPVTWTVDIDFDCQHPCLMSALTVYSLMI